MTESYVTNTGWSSPASIPPADPKGPGDFNDRIIDEYRANGGKLGGMFAGSDLLLLHHTGGQSGTARVSPLAYQRIGNSYAIFASRAGSAANPDWFNNVVASPETVIEVGRDRLAVRARVAQPAERDVIWDRQKKRVPQFAEYERKAAPRKIPVIVLDPVK
ncbi:MAG TPA: nitroreductase/quinone reductase family protein [Trebonia sp.]|nr:nitroreductase/quinone reductase family protein [Trebonia sp.]